jgi:hypothetical protein
MLRLKRIAITAATALMFALASLAASAVEAPVPTPAPIAASAPRASAAPILILRGGLNIFSTGMDDLAKELTAKGYPAISDGFEPWRSHLADIVKAYKAKPYPIVIIGHSYGANTALLMAYELRKEDIPVALLVFYDLTDSAKVPPNVDHVLNFRSSSSTGINVTVTGLAHFHGTIDNVTRPDLNHITIDKQEDLHKQTIDAIAKLFGRTQTTLN